MKAIFSLLLCYVLTTSQSFALSGGPVFGGGVINPVGTYAGVLTPTLDPGNPLTVSNALGLFTLAVPSTLLATGTFILFAEGEVFTGSITGSVDSDSGALLGVIQANYTVPATVAGVQVNRILALAFGKVTGRVRPSGQGAISSARLSGSALLDVTDTSGGFGNFIPLPESLYTVTGFRQSQAAPSGSTTGTGTVAP